ncbi:MAG: ParB/RepB/Spo0J family partition protein [Clostridia bacterium]|nr:ParB/RepB/Spo0J family partition protein [Clostridia bacterium]
MAKKQSGLGRDFFSLLDDNMIESKRESAVFLSVSSIEPRKDQPRKDFDREALESLADSIATYGVLQPIIVRENTNFEGNYEIIAGERRWRASKMAGLNEIPAVVVTGDDLKAAQIAIIENVQREDLNPVEETLAYGALMDRYELTQDQVAKQVGKSRSAVTNMLRLLDLPDEVLVMLREGKITAGHARALLGLNDPEDILPLAQRIVERNMSVRDVEKTIRLFNNPPEREEKDTENQRIKMHMRELERRVMSGLGRKVKITRTPRKKVVELAYDSDEDLEALLTAICGSEIFTDI